MVTAFSSIKLFRYGLAEGFPSPRNGSPMAAPLDVPLFSSVVVFSPHLVGPSPSLGVPFSLVRGHFFFYRDHYFPSLSFPVSQPLSAFAGCFSGASLLNPFMRPSPAAIWTFSRTSLVSELGQSTVFLSAPFRSSPPFFSDPLLILNQ